MYTSMLFLHLCALTGAFFAMGLMVSAAVRGGHAHHVEKFMPVATLVLLATGAYMTHERWTWTTPWIDTGVAGLLLIGIFGGAVLGSGKLRGTALLAGHGFNMGLAVGVMFLMIAKPTLAGSVAALLAGALAGAAGFALLARRRAMAESS